MHERLSIRERLLARCRPALMVLLAAAAPVPAAALSQADFAALPAFRNAIVSPDGSKVLMLRPVGDALAAVVLDIAARKSHLTLVTTPTMSIIDQCVWTSDVRVMCKTVATGAQVSGRDRSLDVASLDDGVLRRYVAVNFDGTEVVELGPSRSAVLISTLPADDEHVLLGMGSWNPYVQGGLYTSISPRLRPRGNRVQRIETRTNESELIQSAVMQTFGWHTDERGVLSASTGYLDERFMLRSRFAGVDAGARPDVVRDVRESLADVGMMRRFSRVPFEAPDSEYPRVVHVGSDGIAWIESRQDGDLNRLVALDLHTGKVLRELHRAANVDVIGEPIAAPGALPIGVRVVGDATSFLPLTDEGVTIRSELDAALPGRTNIPNSLSRDGTKLTVESFEPGRGSSWYYFDRGARRLTLIGHEYPHLMDLPVPAVEVLSLRAADGLQIPVTLFRPAGVTAAGPLVVLLSATPLKRDRDGFDPLVADLVHLGLSVAKVFYRGTPGHGQALRVAGVKQWGGAMDSDVLQATTQLIERKLADPKRVCVLGLGLAGHIALGAARHHPELMRCVASIGAPANMLGFLDEYRPVLFEYMAPAVYPLAPGRATVSHDEHPEDFRVPVLLVHGGLDHEVLPVHSERLAKALLGARKDVTYLPLERSSSDYAFGPDRVQLFEGLSAFLRKHLL